MEVDGVTILVLVAVGVLCFFLGRLVAQLSFKQREKAIREDSVKRSRAVLGGQFSEQLAPFLPDFPFKPTEIKFLGKPVDFIAFEGLDEKDISKVAFVEVKSGKASLSKAERSLKKAIEDGSVSYQTYTVPEEVTHAR